MKRFILIFISLILAVAALTYLQTIELKHLDFFKEHGKYSIMLLAGLTLFPRLTLILSSIPSGGLFWWLALIFCPRYLIAILATFNYFYENPLLVTMSWFLAIGGESSEKYFIHRQYRFRTYGPSRNDEDHRIKDNLDTNTFEAESREIKD